jgi:hypothetical protein
VFFWLQRCFRWSGEHLTKYCRDHIAYDHLFLALYRHEVPEEFANMQYNREWQQYEGAVRQLLRDDKDLLHFVRSLFDSLPQDLGVA